MISKSLLMRIFSGFSMKRWNDIMTPMKFYEMDKQAHKLIYAYAIGKLMEEYNKIDWTSLIEGAIFEFLQRIVLTDINPQVLYKIKSKPDQYKKLNEWVHKNISGELQSVSNEFSERFLTYLNNNEDSLEKRILALSHTLASQWEFKIISKSNPDEEQNEYISYLFNTRISRFHDIEGFKRLKKDYNIQQFINLCGKLRFQIRWSNIYRIPETTVLGHSLFVAILTYLFLGKHKQYSEKRIYNNFFTGLFHDLPEVLTRDIISPIKKSVEGLEELIKEYEEEEMNSHIFPLLPDKWVVELKRFTMNEFSNTIITPDGEEITFDEIPQKYNKDGFSPRDGRFIKFIDDLSAYIEAYQAKIHKNGNEDTFNEAMARIKEKYNNKSLNGYNLLEIIKNIG